MKAKEMMTKVTTKLGPVALKIQKHSPEILLVSGIATGVVTVVLSCKATLKVDDILTESKETINKIHEVADDESKAEEYTEQDKKKDLAITYAQTGVKIVKLYGPAVIMGVVSVSCVLSAHDILRKRNVALAAAYATVDGAFKDYRKRVTDRFGENVDHELRYDIKAKKIEETETDPDTGKTKKVKKTVDVAEFKGDEYARYFDSSCRGYEKNLDYNLMFLRGQQNYFNDLLVARGYVFLNDVYDALGIERTKLGQIVGWVRKNPNPDVSDGFIDFGIKQIRRTVEPGIYDTDILLEFNVDGSILDLI